MSRLRGPRRLYWDDAFAILAEALLLANASVWQWGAKSTYSGLDVDNGSQALGPEFYPNLRKTLDAQFFAELVFYTTLILVKLSFLFFFRRLGENVRNQKRIWWPVLALSLATYFISIGDIHYRCLVRSVDAVLEYCSLPANVSFNMTTLKANMTLDVVSDFLSMGYLP